MNAPVARFTLKTAINMALFTVVGTAILAFTYMQTRELILKSEEAEKLKLITQIVSPNLFDNDIVKDTVEVPASAQLGTDEPGIAYRARLQGKPSVVVLQATAPDGYSGKIRLIVAVREDATVAGVRVVAHKETPGLGDYIEYAKTGSCVAWENANVAGADRNAVTRNNTEI